MEQHERPSAVFGRRRKQEVPTDGVAIPRMKIMAKKSRAKNRQLRATVRRPFFCL